MVIYLFLSNFYIPYCRNELLYAQEEELERVAGIENKLTTLFVPYIMTI